MTGSIVVCAALAACSSYKQTPPPRLAACDAISGTATSYGRSLALGNAEQDLRNQLPEARGELFATGVRRLRVVRTSQSCTPYPIGGSATGLVTCSVTARICGRVR